MSTNPALSIRDRVWWFAAVAVFAVLELAIAVHATNGPLFSRTPRNYYHLMTDALVSGQLSLKIDPNPELLKLPDPYDSATNQPYRLTDLSLYKGRYYFYWGLGPIVLLFGPCFVLTGTYPSEALASALFAIGCQACMTWLLLACRRAYFPRASPLLAGLAVSCVGIASFLVALPLSNSVYDVPVACAAFAQAFAWCCIYAALRSPRPLSWTLLAGCGLALAIGSRADYLLWSACFMVPLWVLIARQRDRRVWLILAASIPPILAVTLLLFINWRRYGQATNFGLIYMLADSGPPHLSLNGGQFLAHLAAYGWSSPLGSRYFPFMAIPRAGSCGMLTILPATYACLGLFVASRMRIVAAMGFAMALAGFCGMAAVAAFPWVAMRYSVDFLPACLAAGSLGAFAISDLSARRNWILLRVGLVLAFAYSIAAALLLQLPFIGEMRSLPLRHVARALNAPTFAYERLAGAECGPLFVRFTLPRGRTGAYEPLVSIGDRSRGGEVIFMTYVDDKHVRFGFFQTDTTHWLSAPLEIDYSRPHDLYAALGALLPPESAPVFDHWPEAARVSVEQTVMLVLDGQLIYRTALNFGIEHGEQYALGVNKVESGVSQPRFTGEILKSRMLPLADDGPHFPGQNTASARQFGGWQIRVVFPSNPSKGRHDPILVSGVPGAADLIYAFYPHAGSVAFGHDSWNFGGSTSQPVSIDMSGEHVIEIRHGGLYPPTVPRSTEGAGPSPGAAMKNHVRIVMDGSVVMDVDEHTFDSAPEMVTAAENRIGGSTTAAVFSGRLVSAKRLGE
jgi:hypothetical protein